MMKTSLYIFVLLALFTALFFLLVESKPENRLPKKGSSLSVLVTVEPIAGLVEAIAGPHVTVSILVPTGKEPETYAPSPREIFQLMQNRIFFRVGLISEETFLPKLRQNAPDLLICDLREGLSVCPSDCSHPDSEAPLHSQHGPNEEHQTDTDHHECGADGLDPHLWMSPEQLSLLVERITAELSELSPENAELFCINAEALLERISVLQRSVQERLAQKKIQAILVFHPAYGYYCREFGLVQLAIEAGGRGPKPQELAALLETIQKKGVHQILTQPEFDQSTALAIAERFDLKLVTHSPLMRDPLMCIDTLTDLLLGSEMKDPSPSEVKSAPLPKGTSLGVE